MARAAFAKAWDKLKSQGDIPAMGVDRSNFAAITRFARQIQHALVESGITETEKVVDAVHETLVEILPGITRREASHHMIGLYLPYLPYTPPSEDPFTEEMKVAGSEEECLAKMREEFAVRRLRQIEEKRMAEEAESRKKPKK